MLLITIRVVEVTSTIFEEQIRRFIRSKDMNTIVLEEVHNI